MNKKQRTQSIGLVAVAVLASSMMGTSVASADVNGSQVAKFPHHYVALGDLLSIGQDLDEHLAHVKAYGFVERLYEGSLYTGRTEMHNYALGGLTTTGLKNYLTAIKVGENTITNQIQPNLADTSSEALFQEIAATKSELNKADLVTVTIGAADFGEDYFTLLTTLTDEQLKQKNNEIVSLYSANLRTSLSLLQELAPNAEIVIADQYVPFAAAIDQKIYDKLQELSKETTGSLDSIVDSMTSSTSHVHVAHLSKQFAGHELEYTNLLQNDVHPTQAGYEAISQEFSQTIWGGQYRHEMHNEPINLVLKGKDFMPSSNPEMIDDHTYLPLAELAMAIGATVSWDEQAQATTLSYKGNEVSFTIDSSVLKVNGEELPIDGTIHMLNSTTYVPLRAISEGLGLDVQYISQDNTVYINE